MLARRCILPTAPATVKVPAVAEHAPSLQLLLLLASMSVCAAVFAARCCCCCAFTPESGTPSHTAQRA